TQRRAEDAQVVPEDPAEIGGRVCARRRAASDDAPALGERGETLVPTLAADAVDNDVDATLFRERARFLGEIALRIIDAVVGAPILCQRELLLGRGRYNDVRAHLLCDLQRGAGDAAADP